MCIDSRGNRREGGGAVVKRVGVSLAGVVAMAAVVARVGAVVVVVVVVFGVVVAALPPAVNSWSGCGVGGGGSGHHSGRSGPLWPFAMLRIRAPVGSLNAPDQRAHGRRGRVKSECRWTIRTLRFREPMDDPDFPDLRVCSR